MIVICHTSRIPVLNRVSLPLVLLITAVIATFGVSKVIGFAGEGNVFDSWCSQPLRYSVPTDLPGCRAENPIDVFIEAKLRQLGLHSQPEADRRTLIRRVTLDLTGLPPSAEEIAEFLSDSRPDAYQRLVDRLLASPAYGERMATPWLDAARYADTNGYEQDNGRNMWPWRDWVVQAFNSGMPFDQFTIEQMAGDLLPGATDQQRLATGFHRNHGLNFEGGSISEESRWNYVHDRVHTTAITWFASTLSCARCHDHKYEPISQKEYYQFAAYFNNIAEEGYAGENGNAEPLLKLPDLDRSRAIRDLQERLEQLEQTIADPTFDQYAYEKWCNELRAGASLARDVLDKPLVRFAFDEAFDDGPLTDDSGVLVAMVSGAVRSVEGFAGEAVLLDGKSWIDLGDVGGFERDQAFTISVFVRPDTPDFGPIVGRVHCQGYDLCWNRGHFEVHLVHRWDGHYLAVRSQRSFNPRHWLHVAVSYDGSSRAEGVRLYVNGEQQPLDILANSLDGSMISETHLFLGVRSERTPERFRGAIDELRLYDRQLSGLEIQCLAEVSAVLDRLLQGKSTPEDEQLLKEHFALRIDVTDDSLSAQRAELLQEISRVERDWPTVMVLAERADKRPTYVLYRGQYDQPTELVQPAIPAAWCNGTKVDLPDRLALARWMVSPNNPRTARVIANFQWELFFGKGLVSTSDDFGSQGDMPTHPELLDWLAYQLIERQWDLKWLHRLIVTSATYRRSSRSTELLTSRDPGNQYYARQSPRRLTAEMVRDAALAATGLLDRTMGGPGVHPYQPPGLWSELSFHGDYSAQHDQLSEGADRYRRSLYTYWKRTCPPPFLTLFDAPDRETCQVSRPTTATPLQALALMNDPTFLEASGYLAAKLLTVNHSHKIRWQEVFERIMGRLPSSAEYERLERFLADAQDWYAHHPEQLHSLAKMCATTGLWNQQSAEWAAWTVAIHAVLVSPAALTRE